MARNAHEHAPAIAALSNAELSRNFARAPAGLDHPGTVVVAVLGDRAVEIAADLDEACSVVGAVLRDRPSVVAAELADASGVALPILDDSGAVVRAFLLHRGAVVSCFYGGGVHYRWDVVALLSVRFASQQDGHRSYRNHRVRGAFHRGPLKVEAAAAQLAAIVAKRQHGANAGAAFDADFAFTKQRR